MSEAEEKAKKERDRKKREEEKARRPDKARSSPSRKASPKDGGEGDDTDLDEDDLKIIRDTKKQGYCYFKRTLSEQEQTLLEAEQNKLRAVRRRVLGQTRVSNSGSPFDLCVF